MELTIRLEGRQNIEGILLQKCTFTKKFTDIVDFSKLIVFPQTSIQLTKQA